MLNHLNISEKLKSSREEKNLSLEIVSYETKIPKSYIEFLEGSLFHNFKTFNQCRDYLKIYCDYLDLNSENYIKILERDLLANPTHRQAEIISKQKKEKLKSNISKRYHQQAFTGKVLLAIRKSTRFVIQWRKILFGLLFILISTITFVYVFNASVKPPDILLESPLDLILDENIELSTTDRSVVFKGRVEGVGELLINNKVVRQRVGGFFETESFPLTQAENKFLFITRNLYGNANEFILNLKRSDIISRQGSMYPILIETVGRAGFVLIKADNEIVFNDFTNTGDQIGINVARELSVESTNFENIRILFGDKSYQMLQVQEVFELSELGLTRK